MVLGEGIIRCYVARFVGGDLCLASVRVFGLRRAAPQKRISRKPDPPEQNESHYIQENSKYVMQRKPQEQIVMNVRWCIRIRYLVPISGTELPVVKTWWRVCMDLSKGSNVTINC